MIGWEIPVWGKMRESPPMINVEGHVDTPNDVIEVREAVKRSRQEKKRPYTANNCSNSTPGHLASESNNSFIINISAESAPCSELISLCKVNSPKKKKSILSPTKEKRNKANSKTVKFKNKIKCSPATNCNTDFNEESTIQSLGSAVACAALTAVAVPMSTSEKEECQYEQVSMQVPRHPSAGWSIYSDDVSMTNAGKRFLKHSLSFSDSAKVLYRSNSIPVKKSQ